MHKLQTSCFLMILSFQTPALPFSPHMFKIRFNSHRDLDGNV